MAIRWLMGGGNMIASGLSGVSSVPGIITESANNVFSSTASTPTNTPGDGFAFLLGGANTQTLNTPVLGAGGYAGLIAGMRSYSALASNKLLINFSDGLGNTQCELRMNLAGQLYFTRNNTVISTTSTYALPANSWVYIEFKALFSNAGTGTCEARVNGGVVLTATGLTNAQNTSGGSMAYYTVQPGGYLRDLYALDTATAVNQTYLGDVNIVALYPNGAGVNSAWTANVGPFSVTSVANASGGNTVYTMASNGSATNNYLGYNFVTSGFAHGANNGTFACVASTATTFTLANAAGVSDTTGSIAFQNPLQIGINHSGTRPNGDVVYLADSTTNDISDFAHTPLTLTGSILGVSHWSSMRKDDAGSRAVAQVCLSGGTTETGATINLGNSYTYYQDILEVDPHTSAQFTLSGLNAATFGVKEIT
jgi:hypothetical protein